VGSDASALIERGVTSIRFDPDPESWGIAPVVSTLNAVLRTMAGSLECSFEPISRFQDWEFEDRLKVLTQSNHFPIVGFDYNSLFGELGQDGQGHCAVVYGTRQMNQFVIEIYDPGPDRAGFKEVDSYSLYRACRRKHGGIWVVEQTGGDPFRAAPVWGIAEIAISRPSVRGAGCPWITTPL
jgi:hypothetical protein